MNNFQNKNKAGFTLIELLVVIAIIGVLSGVVLQSLKGARQRSQNATRLSDIDQINKALELYFTKQNTGVGSFPISGTNVWQCIGLTTGTCWASPGYNAPPSTGITINSALTGNISKIPKDPFLGTGVNGNYYIYNSSYAGTSGTGAYLSWFVNALSTKPCGRGYSSGAVTAGMQQCLLYLGK